MLAKHVKFVKFVKFVKMGPPWLDWYRRSHRRLILGQEDLPASVSIASAQLAAFRVGRLSFGAGTVPSGPSGSCWSRGRSSDVQPIAGPQDDIAKTEGIDERD